MIMVRPPEQIGQVSYFLVFELAQKGDDKIPSFPSVAQFVCDPNGKVDPASLPKELRELYLACSSGALITVNESVTRFEHSRTCNAIGICEDCMQEIELAGYSNACSCGASYNLQGVRLPSYAWLS